VKKVVYALLFSSSMISGAFAAKNRDVVSALNTTAAGIAAVQSAEATASSAVNAADASVQAAFDPAIDSVIDDVAAQTTNAEALSMLAWLKANPTATIALGIAAAAGTLVGIDYVYHKYNAKEGDEVAFEKTYTGKLHQQVSSSISTKFLYYTAAVVAAVLVAADLSKDQKSSYLKSLFACIFPSSTTPAATTPAATVTPATAE
jgi:hypothetical protein